MKNDLWYIQENIVPLFLQKQSRPNKIKPAAILQFLII